MDRQQQFGFLLHDVTRLYRRRYEQRAMDLALTLPQCRTLYLVARNEGISQKKLADLAELDPMTMVRILDRMEADGWVERRSHPEDRRARSLSVTRNARPVLEQILAAASQTRSEALHGLSNEERNQLISLLEKVHANLGSLAPLADAARGPA